MRSVADKVLTRIQGKGQGWAFTAKDFLDMGSRASVDQALSGICKQGRIRRVCRGIYDLPRPGKLIDGPMPADFDQVAHAIARSTGTRIHPSGAVAANLLGLSQQVPAKIVYLTDGLTRTVKIGVRTIALKRVRPKELLSDEKSGMVVQALRFIGRDALTDEIMDRVRNQLTPAQRKRLIKEAQYTSDWIAEAARRITGDE